MTTGVVSVILQVVGILACCAALVTPAHAQRAGASDVLVVGVTGQPTVGAGSTSRPLKFGDAVGERNPVTTDADASVELMVGRHALVVVDTGSRMSVGTEEPGRSVIRLDAGSVRLNVAASALGPSGAVVVSTPTAVGLLRDGVVVVTVSPNGAASFRVVEGSVQVSPPVPGATAITATKGEGVDSVGGLLRRSAVAAGTLPIKRPVVASGSHAVTPASGVERLLVHQVAQVVELDRRLQGLPPLNGVLDAEPVIGDPVSVETRARAGEPTDAVISTRDVTGSASATSSASAASSPSSPSSPSAPSSPPAGSGLFALGPSFTAGTPTPVNVSGSGVLDDSNVLTILIQTGPPTSLAQLPGGPASLVIDRLSLKATSELLNVNVDKRADPNAAGRRLTQAPNVTLLITRPAAHSETPPTQLTGLPVTLEVKEQGARVPVVSSAQIGEHTSLFISQPLPASVNATAALNEFSRVPVGGAPVPLVEATRSSVAVLDTIGGPALVSQLGQASDAERAVSLIDATVRRTAPGDLGAAPLRFSAGVVLNETSLLTTFDVDPPATGENLIATVTNIEGQNLSTEQRTQLQARLKPPGNIVRDRLGSNDMINGSLVSVVGEPGPAGTSARVVFDDRALAILHGSVRPDTSGSRAALVTVLDGQLTGPSTVPATRTGDDVGVPPLIEVIDSNPPSATDTPGIQAVSAVVVRSTRSATSLDPALLEATAPLLALTRSSMSASGHLVDLAGTASNGKPLLTATLVPGDALVRLDASSLAVKGNLLNLASGATATITGNLFSLNNGSTLTIDGALVKIGAGSSFTLNNGSFGSFGASGTNTLTVRNNLCDGACRTINNIPVFAPGVQDLQQVIKITGTFAPFSAPPGTPVTASGVPANAQVNIGPGAALLHVEPGGSVTIKGR